MLKNCKVFLRKFRGCVFFYTPCIYCTIFDFQLIPLELKNNQMATMLVPNSMKDNEIILLKYHQHAGHGRRASSCMQVYLYNNIYPGNSTHVSGRSCNIYLNCLCIGLVSIILPSFRWQGCNYLKIYKEKLSLYFSGSWQLHPYQRNSKACNIGLQLDGGKGYFREP